MKRKAFQEFLFVLVWKWTFSKRLFFGSYVTGFVMTVWTAWNLIFSVPICGTFLCGIKTDIGQMFCNVTAIWRVMSDFMQHLHIFCTVVYYKYPLPSQRLLINPLMSIITPVTSMINLGWSLEWTITLLWLENSHQMLNSHLLSCDGITLELSKQLFIFCKIPAVVHKNSNNNHIKYNLMTSIIHTIQYAHWVHN